MTRCPGCGRRWGRGNFSMNRRATTSCRRHCSRSPAPLRVSGMSTTLIFTGSSPAATAARIPVSTDGSRSRREGREVRAVDGIE